MSKKGYRLTNDNNDFKDYLLEGEEEEDVWKERWVVLQGKSLLLHRKHKDTVKKVVELQTPLTVVTAIIPHDPQYGLKQSPTTPMSNTLIALTVSLDPTVPKIYFRAPSESELTHWVRIFNSLNCTLPQGIAPPPFDPVTIHVSSPMAKPIQLPPPLPPLPFEPPPISLDGTVVGCSLTKSPSWRQSCTTISANNSCVNGNGAENGDSISLITPFIAKRGRDCAMESDSIITISQGPNLAPSINPALILNAAMVFSNLQQGPAGGDNDGSGNCGSSSSSSIKDIPLAGISYHTPGLQSYPEAFSGAVEKSRCYKRASALASTLAGSLLSGKSLNQIQSHSPQLSRRTSLQSSSTLVNENYRSRPLIDGHKQEQVQDQETWYQQPSFASTAGHLHARRNTLKDRFQRSRGSKLNSYLHPPHCVYAAVVGVTPKSSSDALSTTNASDTMDKNLLPQLDFDPASQALLQASTSRSSAPPLFCGHIWLYVPNSTSNLKLDTGISVFSPTATITSDNGIPLPPIIKTVTEEIKTAGTREALPEAPSVGRSNPCSPIPSPSPKARWPSSGLLAKIQPTSLSSTSRGFVSKAANIPIAKASGRYVKCFVVINALGQFHWVEVNKDPSQENHMDCADLSEYGGTAMKPNPIHGIQLNAKRPSDWQAGSVAPFGISADRGPRQENKGMGGRKNSGFQVSMAYKMRLRFFCLKISASSLAEAMVEAQTVSSLNQDQIESSNSGCGSLLADQQSSPRPHIKRFSAPLTHQRMVGSSLSEPSDRPLSLQKIQTRNIVPNGTPMENPKPIWPSMSFIHEKAPSPSSQATARTRNTLSVPPPERSVSKSPSPLKPALSTQAETLPPGHVAKSLLSRTKSLFVENRTRVRSAPPGSMLSSVVEESRHNLFAPGSLLKLTGTLYPSAEEKIAATASKTSEVELLSDIRPTSHVLSLAGHLQKAMQSRVQAPGTQSYASQGASQQQRQYNHGKEKSNDKEVVTKPSLQEVTAKKRASAQKLKDSVNVEAAQLKLVGGVSDNSKPLREKLLKEGFQEHGREMAKDYESKKENDKENDKENMQTTIRSLLQQCPFLELSPLNGDDGDKAVTLKGYTETEEAWKALQCALERFIDGPIKDHRSALPPEETLIPSYHAPRLPEVRLSMKAQNPLKAKGRAAAAAAATTEPAAEECEANMIKALLNGLHDDNAVDTVTGYYPPPTLAGTGLSRVNTFTTFTSSSRSEYSTRYDKSSSSSSASSVSCISRSSSFKRYGSDYSHHSKSITANPTLANFLPPSVPLMAGVGHGPKGSLFAAGFDAQKANGASDTVFSNNKTVGNEHVSSTSRQWKRHTLGYTLAAASDRSRAGPAAQVRPEQASPLPPSGLKALGRHQRTCSGNLLGQFGPSFTSSRSQQSPSTPALQCENANQQQHKDLSYEHRPPLQMRTTGAALTKWRTSLAVAVSV
ncbi:hypothetical protein BX616_007181 [Lobosporangium transversale]|nr:hypothetical protein BX616_007181 [Lobosporangium transversale]